MCGIVGIFGLNGQPAPDASLLKTMADTFTYRGPDDEGYYVEGALGFGFKRLSIIDLVGGHQPLSNEDDSIILICNGEIYNYRELRKRLQGKRHRFKTDCDVEVILHLYEEYGTELLTQLNGQFGFALFDKKQQKLLLARDHVGITPLFYTVVDNTLIFASEIKALLKHPLVKPAVHLTGLDQIFTFPGMASPHTMFENIHALKPGHYLTAQNGHIAVKEYWDLSYPAEEQINSNLSETDAIDMLEEKLQQAVRYRLNADVPVGFYLSGGLDSSLIASLIHQLSPQEQRHSFSIGFTQNAIDERQYQHLMSAHVGSTHHEIIFDWQHITERLRAMVYHAESPLKESYNTCSLALSELVHQNNMKVVLTGEGADELFAGYVGYRLDQQRQDENVDPFDLEAMLEQQLQEQLWGDSQFFFEKHYHAFQDTKQALYSAEVLEQFQDFECTQHQLVDVDKLRRRSALHKRAYLNFKFRLSDHLLADHGDRVLYANSVEGRYPFLDIDVIECAKTLPPDLLMRDMEEKYILKQIAQRYVPSRVVKREKFGFVAPSSPFLLQQNLEWINDLLSYERIRRMGYFNPDTVERLRQTYSEPGFTLSQTYEDDFLMIILTFNLFAELFDVPDFR